MKKILLLSLFSAIVSAQAVRPAPPKSGNELPVIAQWDFQADKPNCSNGQYIMWLRGTSKIVPLQDHYAMTIPDEGACGMVSAKSYPELTPESGFRLTVRFYLDQYFIDKTVRQLILWDNLQPGSSKTPGGGFKLVLNYHGRGDFTPLAYLGTEGNTLHIRGKRLSIPLHCWHQFELEYNGIGEVKMLFNGTPAGSGLVLPGALGSSSQRLVIGGSVKTTNIRPYSAYIGRVLLNKLPDTPVFVAPLATRRRVFMQMEKKVALSLVVCNFSKDELVNPIIELGMHGVDMPTQTFTVPAIKPGTRHEIRYPVDTRLLPGEQRLLCRLSRNEEVLFQNELSFFIIEPMPEKLPVRLMSNLAQFDPELAKKLGFDVVCSTGFVYFQDHSVESLIQQNNDFEQHARAGLSLEEMCGPGNFRKRADFLTVARDGKPYPGAEQRLNAANAEFVREYTKRVISYIESLDHHPSVRSVKINDELPPSRQPDFSLASKTAFKRFSGHEIPDAVKGPRAPSPLNLPEFSPDGIVADDNLLLTYYRWFWTVGSGWETLNSKIAAIFKNQLGNHIASIALPATRCPPYWGGGGEVDIVQNWTYINPYPNKIMVSCDELRALAAGREGQEIYNSIQGIAWRRDLAPREITPPNPPEWLKMEEDASYISTPPDAMREAFWCLLSQKMAAIGTFAAGSLFVPTSPGTGHRLTNLEAGKVWTEMVEKVVKPLGPMLVKIPERKPDIAILESFTNVVFGGNHPNSWSSGRIADLHLALQYAHMQPSIIYEDELVEGGGEKIKLLFLPGLETVSEKLHRRLLQLQEKGVILLGDELTYPALMPDFRFASVLSSSNDPRESKLALQSNGQKIRDALKDVYASAMSASNADIVLRRRGGDTADYVFAINDKRVFGDYIGAWKRMEEKGLAQSGRVTIGHETKAAYDLVRHAEIAFDLNNGETSFAVHLDPCDGMILLLMQQKICKIEIGVPDSVKLGDQYSISVRVLDESDRPIRAMLPFALTLTGSDGKQLPGSMTYAASNGEKNITMLAALDQAPGRVNIGLQCLASGLMTSKNFMIK